MPPRQYDPLFEYATPWTRECLSEFHDFPWFYANRDLILMLNRWSSPIIYDNAVTTSQFNDAVEDDLYNYLLNDGPEDIMDVRQGTLSDQFSYKVGIEIYEGRLPQEYADIFQQYLDVLREDTMRDWHANSNLGENEGVSASDRKIDLLVIVRRLFVRLRLGITALFRYGAYLRALRPGEAPMWLGDVAPSVQTLIDRFL